MGDGFIGAAQDGPQLIEQARLAEESGFDGLWISDHYHPWNDEQGQSAFVWSSIGAISQVCELAWQIQGRAAGRQVEGATIGLTINQGLFGHGSAVIVSK